MATIAASFCAALGLLHLDPKAVVGATQAAYFPMMTGPGISTIFVVIAVLHVSIPARVLFGCCCSCFYRNPDRSHEKADEQGQGRNANSRGNDGGAVQSCIDIVLFPYRFYRRTFGGDSDFGIHGKHW